MDRTQPITLDREDTIDDWIDALQPEQQYWGARCDTVTRATLRLMADSDETYTRADLVDVFDDPQHCTAALYAAIMDERGEQRDREALARALEDDLLFTRRVSDTTEAHRE